MAIDALQRRQAHAVICDLAYGADLPAAPDADDRRLVAAVLAGIGEDLDRRRRVQDWPGPVPPFPTTSSEASSPEVSPGEDSG